ncbi:MAG: hypothetical protein AB1Z20_09420 [Desulfobacterales bacterium]|jgi:hypothetical protein
MPLPPPKQRTAYGTYLYFVKAGALEKFLQDYRQILTTHFQKVRIEGGGEYWTCGKEHDPRNWNWKPWQHLEWLCRQRGLDDISCSGPSLEEYLPKNQEEKNIISLLIQYQDAKINCDLDQFLDCLFDLIS